ncbi:MAG: glycoside hydrolase family 88 protein [Treponema sp.]|jgi:unsaturated rhamnogalacturonyl hydrolase|nr:glycoside hydrolase family 88 protein [Treponema sp.]
MERAFLLARHTARRFCPDRMKWMWGQGLYNYALSLMDEAHGTDEFTGFLSRYYDSHIQGEYRIESSDTAAPALGAYMLWKKTANPAYKRIADDAATYMHTAPRILEYLPNHMGTGPYSIYPKSVWVDSVMMYGVFAGRYSHEQKDGELATFATRQVPLFARYLRDKKLRLFYHSYWTSIKGHYPRRPVFWGRGNGWIMAALPLMLPYLENGVEKEETINIFRDLARALLPYQRPDGFFQTVLYPHTRSYRESSATALIASGLMFGGRTGLLDKECLEAGKKAFAAVENSIREDKDGLCLPEISAPTIPVPGLPLLGYLLTPRGQNLTYGLAALIFAALEEEKLS